ncbi:MAG: cyclic nucleotide-binding domain-containing protein [Acidimicrobiales bacterium]|nr:cyclic nucleotide-binding domain-containing protein [Acidimicrobiales bacterium]
MMDELGQIRELHANEMLFAAGDDSDAVYLVVDGSLEVVHSTETGDLVVGILGPTEIVGEITAVIGGRRTATVRAGDTPVTVREFSADSYGEWLQDRPEEAQRIAEQARNRIDKTRVARVLTDLIGPGHPDVIDDVNELLEWTRLEAG